MKVQVIVPTHNRKKQLGNLLYCLKNQTVQINILIIVDGSTDGTLEMLNKEYPQVDYIVGSGDWWYTKSMNEGFKYAIKKNDPELFLAMNDDLEVKEDYISALLNAYKSVKGNCLMGSISFTKSEPARVVNSGGLFQDNYLGIVESHIPIFKKANPTELKGRVLKSDFLPGRGMLIPKDILIGLNFFDENFKQYHSDWDFCLRAKDVGYQSYVSWSAQVFVDEKMTGKGTSYLRESFLRYLMNYFDFTSRLYLPAKARFNWRHRSKLFWPINMLIFLFVSLKNFITKDKID